MPANPAAKPDEAAVLTRAFLRAGGLLDLPQRTLARVVGVSEASLSRLAGARQIEPASKEGELALLFVRLFRSLDAHLGGNTDQCRAWMHAENRHLGGVPADLVQSASGLVHVVDYVDAMRGKN